MLRQPLAFVAFLLLVALAPLRAGSALDQLPRAAVAYAFPQIGPDGQVQQRKVDGVDRLVFTEVAAGEDAKTDAVRAHLEKSPAWDLVRRLYAFAWKRTGAKDDGQFVIAVTDTFGGIGPSHAPYAVVVERKDGSTVNAGSFIIVSDIGTEVTVELLIKNDYLGLALAHESAHQVMFDRFGSKDFPRNLSQSKDGHDTHEITDPALAFSEGWAEAFEAIVGDLLESAGASPKIETPSIAELKKRRHEMIEADKYVFEDPLAKTGRVRTGMQLVSTEGVVAYLCYQSYANRIFKAQGQPDAYGAVLDTLARHKPHNVVEFWNATMEDMPGQRDKLVRIFLEWTKYGTVSPEAAGRYFNSWQTKQAAAKLPEGHPGKRDAMNDAHRDAADYRVWRDQLYAAVLKSGRLDGALPPGLDPLWIDHGLRRVGLNVTTPEELGEFLGALMGATENDQKRAAEWLAKRDAGTGYFGSLDALNGVASPAELAALQASRNEYASNRTSGVSAFVMAYVKRHGEHALDARLAQRLSGR